MPILREFCYFCGLGVIFLFLFASTFFVACVLLDEKRKESQKMSRPDWNPASWTRARPGVYIFKNYISPMVIKWPVALTIILISIGLAAGGVYGVANIEVDYDSIWYMRHDSYPYKFYKTLGEQFTGQGEKVEIFFGKNLKLSLS